MSELRFTSHKSRLVVTNDLYLPPAHQIDLLKSQDVIFRLQQACDALSEEVSELRSKVFSYFCVCIHCFTLKTQFRGMQV